MQALRRRESDSWINVGIDVSFEKLAELGIGFKTGPSGFRQKRPTLVMIHGAGGSVQIWQSQIHLLNNSMNTLALDLPAHGGTAGQAQEWVEPYARWLSEILSTLFHHQPVFLMGHSMGGAIVQETALLDPKLLKGIILTSTGSLLPVSPVFLKGLLNDFENTVETIMGYAYAPNADRSLLREGTKLMKQSGSKVVYSDFLACDRFDRQNDLVNIAMPCLIVCGEMDKLTPPALSKTLHEYIHGSILKIIPAVGHMAMVENYRLFNDHVRDFVHGF